ncbi:cupin domain-containing protein [Ramlibacter sp. CGMCC 1.13660]|nr:cupin domain-containing protein [Ramlibacter sp. CGMCC 1.13660]
MTAMVRRVVTGHDANGKAIVLSDGPSPFIHTTPLRPGYVSTDIFRTLETPASIAGETAETTLGPRRQLPTPRGSVIRVNVFPPDRGSLDGMDVTTSSQLFESLGNPAGHTYAASGRHPLMHRTETIDYAIVLDGEITMLLDDSEVVLRAGDILVQCGTNHAWSNRSDAPATVVFVLIDGKYEDDLAQRLPSGHG